MFMLASLILITLLAVICRCSDGTVLVCPGPSPFLLRAQSHKDKPDKVYPYKVHRVSLGPLSFSSKVAEGSTLQVLWKFPDGAAYPCRLAYLSFSAVPTLHFLSVSYISGWWGGRMTLCWEFYVYCVHHWLPALTLTVVPTGIEDTICCQMPEELSSILRECVQLYNWVPVFWKVKPTTDIHLYRKHWDKRWVQAYLKDLLEETGTEFSLDPEQIMWDTARYTCNRVMTVWRETGPGSARKSSYHACSGWLSVWSGAGRVCCWLNFIWDSSMDHWSCSGVTYQYVNRTWTVLWMLQRRSLRLQLIKNWLLENT